MADQILDAISVFHYLGNVSVFKLFIVTVVKNFVLNKGMHGHDLP